MYSLQVGGTHPTGMFFVVQVFTCTCRYALCSATQWMNLCAALTWLAVTATTGNYLSIMAISIDRYTLYSFLLIIRSTLFYVSDLVKGHFRPWNVNQLAVWSHLYFKGLVFYYRPQRSCGQGNVFTGVCLSTGGRVSASVHAGMPYPPRMESPPGWRTPPRMENPPEWRTPPDGEPTPPDGGTPPEKQTPAYGLRSYWNAFLFIILMPLKTSQSVFVEKHMKHL